MNELTVTLLFAFVLNASSIPSSAKFRSKRVVTCSNPIPDFHLFEYGYDATKIDIFRCPEIGGKKGLIFDLNKCNRRDIWETPKTQQHYDLPDLLSIVKAENTGNTQSVFTTIDEYKLDLRTVTEIDVEYTNGLFSNSDDYRKRYLELANHSKVVIATQSMVNYGVKLRDNDARKTAISDEFKYVLASLPDNFEGNEKQYITFIESFGTHYLFRGSFGAKNRRVTTVDAECYFDSENELIQNATVNFPDVMDDDYEACSNDDKRKIAQFVNKELNYVQSFYGGFIFDIKRQGAEMWFDRAENSPTLVSMRLRPISQLIDATHFPDKRNHSEIANELHKAIITYMTRAHLDEQIVSLRVLISQGETKTTVPQMVIDEYEKLIINDKYKKSVYDSLLERISFETQNIITERENVNDRSGAINVFCCVYIQLASFMAFVINVLSL